MSASHCDRRKFVPALIGERWKASSRFDLRLADRTRPHMAHSELAVRLGFTKVSYPSVDAPFRARENVGVVVARGRMLSSVRPLMRQEDSRRPVWEFADRVQITQSVLEAQWKALVVPATSRRLLRHTLLPLTLTSS